MDINIFFPVGAFGASEDDTLLDTILRNIAVKASEDPEGEWAEKYGTEFENEVFMMHPFCWCEQDDCPWCCGCECDEDSIVYTIDGKQVTFEEWMNFFEDNVPKIDINWTKEQWEEYEKLVDIVNSRRDSYVLEDKKCDFCKTGGISKEYGGEPEKGAPNFWYKPLDFKVWWYKYIGRDVEINKELTQEQLKEMYERCINSINK